MKSQPGRNLPLSVPRRLISDMMDLSRDVAAIPMERRMALGRLVHARELAETRVGWCAIFTKAYALVCARRPELRRAYLNFPWPRLYEHSANIATIAVERRVGDEDGVFFMPIADPDRRPLLVLDAYLRRCKEDTLDAITWFREALKFGRLPRPLRRAILWWRTQVSGPRRAYYLGTFGVSVTAGLGATQLSLRSPVTTVLHYGQFDRQGELDVRITFDHRVLDGGTVARAMADLEAVLLNEILAELDGLRLARAA
jgi:hypothetical protein